MTEAKAEDPCTVHPDAASLKPCFSCGREMCGTCWTHSVDARPWCQSCVSLLSEPVPGLVYFAGAMLASSVAWLVTRALPFELVPRLVIFAIAALAACIAAWRLRSRAGARLRSFDVRVRTDADPEPPRASPTGYRSGRAPLRVRRVSPPVSGALAALIVGMAMALTAGTIPSLLQLPRWLEFEIVLGLWWVVWATTFTILLVRGWRVARDLKGLRANDGTPSSDDTSGSTGSWADSLGGGVDAEGCAVLIGVIVAVGIAFLIAELIVPALLIAAYWLIVRGLSAVANDKHECKGHIGRAFVWGSVWATVYTLPLAGLVWAAHWVLSNR